MCELERILKQVRQRRIEDLFVCVDGHAVRDGSDRELQATVRGFDRRADRHLFDEIGNQDIRQTVDAGVQAYLRKGAIEQGAHTDEAAKDDSAGAPADPDRSGLQRGECERCGIECVPQLVRQNAEMLGALIGDGFLALPPELGDRRGNGAVEAAVEGPELVAGDRRAAFDGEVGNRLAKPP